jgi:hypothetical protein
MAGRCWVLQETAEREEIIERVAALEEAFTGHFTDRHAFLLA